MSAMKGRKENFRVVVEPRYVRGYTNDQSGYERWAHCSMNQCGEIASAIKRHVDDVNSVSVEFDQSDVCEHCGNAWTENSRDYNGGCCWKDEENAPPNNAEAKVAP